MGIKDTMETEDMGTAMTIRTLEAKETSKKHLLIK